MLVGVTGMSGFTGAYLAEELRSRGHEPVSLGADLTDAGAVSAQIEHTRPDAVVHLAGRAFVDSTDHDAFYAVNQVGTFHLLEALAKHVPDISVVLASSAQVYGASASGLVRESEPMRPGNPYALSKAAMEMGSRMWSDRLRITLVRPFNYTGVGQECRYLVPKLVKHFQRRESVIKLGNIDVERDFGDVRSVVNAYCALIELAPNLVLNVSTGIVTSIRSVVACLSALTGHFIDIEVDAKLVRAADVPVLGGDNKCLQELLPTWKPRSLNDTLAWMLKG